MEPLLKAPSNKGHHRKCLPIKDTFLGLKNELSYSANTFLYSGQISWSQCVLYEEVPLYTYYYDIQYLITCTYVCMHIFYCISIYICTVCTYVSIHT